MSEIVQVTAMEVMDSRGNPTVRAEVVTARGARGVAIVPSGGRTGLAGGATDFEVLETHLVPFGT